MNTQDLLDTVNKHESVIITVEASQAGVIKRRLSNMRSRQQVALGCFADNRRLEYKILPALDGIDEGLIRMRISLVHKGKRILGITEIVPAKEF